MTCNNGTTFSVKISYQTELCLLCSVSMKINKKNYADERAAKRKKDIMDLLANGYLIRHRITKKQPRIKPRVGIFGNSISVKVKRTNYKTAANENSPKVVPIKKHVQARIDNDLGYLLLNDTDNSKVLRPVESYINKRFPTQLGYPKTNLNETTASNEHERKQNSRVEEIAVESNINEILPTLFGLPKTNSIQPVVSNERKRKQNSRAEVERISPLFDLITPPRTDKSIIVYAPTEYNGSGILSHINTIDLNIRPFWNDSAVAPKFSESPSEIYTFLRADKSLITPVPAQSDTNHCIQYPDSSLPMVPANFTYSANNFQTINPSNRYLSKLQRSRLITRMLSEVRNINNRLFKKQPKHSNIICTRDRNKHQSIREKLSFSLASKTTSTVIQQYRTINSNSKTGSKLFQQTVFQTEFFLEPYAPTFFSPS